MRGKPEVLAEGGVEHGEQNRRELRSVSPVHRPFGIGAVRSVAGLHRARQVFKRAPDRFFGQRRLEVGDGERSGDHAGMADRIPVVAAGNPPLLSLIRGLEPLVDDGAFDQGAFVRSQQFIQPVVADGKGEGHFADVEIVGRIPVGVAGRIGHFADRTVRIFAFAAEQPGCRERVDAVQHVPAGGEQPAPLHLPRLRRIAEQELRIVQKARFESLPLRRRRIAFQDGKSEFPDQQPGVGGTDSIHGNLL